MTSIANALTKWKDQKERKSASASDSNEADKEVWEEVGKRIQQGQVSLTEVVEQLGSFLTSTDSALRAHGTGFLSLLLSQLLTSAFRIPQPALALLVQFYADRLQDASCMKEVLEGILALLKNPNITKDSILTLLKSLFANVNLQSYAQGTRFIAFQIIKTCLDNHLASIQQLNEDFVVGFIHLLDGERDPRNLRTAFSIVSQLIANFDISKHAEELFDVTACYFPITFQPLPNDPHGITQDGLKKSLRKCLAASPHFASFGIPLILDKLSASSGETQVDALETLAECAGTYAPESLKPFHEVFWIRLKQMIFQAPDVKVEKAALEALKSICISFSLAPVTPEISPLRSFITPILAECKVHLQEPEHKLAVQSGRVLATVASSTDPACVLVFDSVIPPLITLYFKGSKPVQSQQNILEILFGFIQASRALYPRDGSNHSMEVDEEKNPLLPSKDKLLSIFTESMTLNEREARLVATRAFSHLIDQNRLLSSAEVQQILNQFGRSLLNEKDEQVRSELLETLKRESTINTTFITSEVFPLFYQIFDQENIGPNEYQQALRALSELCIEEELFKMTISKLLQEIDRKSQNKGFSLSALGAIQEAIRRWEEKKHAIPQAIAQELSRSLISKVVLACAHSESDPNLVFLDNDVLTLTSAILSSVIRLFEIREQKEFLQFLHKLFEDGDCSQLESRSSVKNFHPFKDLSSLQIKSLCLYTASFGFCHKELWNEFSGSHFLELLVPVSLNSRESFARIAATKLSASILNKMQEGEELEKNVKKITSMDLSSFDSEKQKALLNLWCWTSKALVMRSHKLGFELAERLVSLLKSKIEIAKEVAERVNIVAGESTDILNKESHAVIKFLYKQRLFTQLKPLIVSGFSEAETENKPSYLIALSGLLLNIPKQVLLGEIKSLVGMLLQSLSVNNAQLKLSTLNIFAELVASSPEIIKDHLTSIIPLLIALSQNKDQNPAVVRETALKTLSQIGTLNYIWIHPFKDEVVKSVSTALDDHKRVVRKAAVLCRTTWFLANEIKK